tara:strand:+ start:357 stop:575 length:219 start_codon:yes stop_codon:yes gene_type:complete
MKDNYLWADAHQSFGKYTVTVEVCDEEESSRADVYRNDGEFVNLTVADNDIRFDISPDMYLKMTAWAYANGW